MTLARPHCRRFTKVKSCGIFGTLGRVGNSPSLNMSWRTPFEMETTALRALSREQTHGSCVVIGINSSSVYVR